MSEFRILGFYFDTTNVVEFWIAITILQANYDKHRT